MSSLDNTTIEIRTIDESDHHILPHQQFVQIEVQQHELVEHTQHIEVQEIGGNIIINRHQPIQLNQGQHVVVSSASQGGGAPIIQQLILPTSSQSQIIHHATSPAAAHHIQQEHDNSQEENQIEEIVFEEELIEVKTKIEHSPKKYLRENIFDISEAKYTPKEDLNEFYYKFRASVCDHFRKTGFELGDDEILPPMCEELIVVWCLEKIDPSVPKQVKETFGPQLQGDITLKDLQEEIFKVIPVFLNLNDKEGYEDDSFFEAKELIWIFSLMKIFTVA
jgi:hypothetical protein